MEQRKGFAFSRRSLLQGSGAVMAASLFSPATKAAGEAADSGGALLLQ